MRTRRTATWLLVAAWAALVGLGLGLQWSLGLRAGPVAPLTGRDRGGAGRIVLAVHPRCPCTRATLTQLERMTAQLAEPPPIEVLVYLPPGEPKTWAEGDLLDGLEALPGSEIRFDPDGAMAWSAGLRTSGELVYRDQLGRPRFRGGITAARGEAGDCAALRALAGAVGSPRGEGSASFAAYGCSLGRPSAGPAPRRSDREIRP